MGDNSKISWTDATWSCVRGCSRISAGCQNCYAEAQAARIVRMGKGKPTKYDRLVKLTAAGEPRWTGRVELDAGDLADPLRWRKPRRIFVNSMSDLFHESFANEQIAAVFGVMAAARQHTFQILTKRAKRMREWFAWLEEHVEADAVEWSGRECGVSVYDARKDCILEYLDETATSALAGHFDACHLGLTTSETIHWPLANVWLGVSVENQAAADERIPDLLVTPAAVRWISAEPLLGPIAIEHWLDLCHKCHILDNATLEERHAAEHGPAIRWVVAGCESGPGARPCDVAWLRSLRDQCQAAGVPLFLKQAVENSARTPAANAASWPSSSLSRNLIEFGPGSKRKAEHLIELPYLDGVQHAAMPGQ